MDYGETPDARHVHPAIQREPTEPRAGFEPLSVWLIAVYALAIFFGAFYLGRYAGSFSGDSLDPVVIPRAANGSSRAAAPESMAELSPAARGKKIFVANCATCHQANGMGVAGQYPPLAGSEYALGGTRRLGMIVLKGLQGPLQVRGAQYGSAVMQPWEKTLTDAKIADVLTYIRSDWGNNAPPVAPEGIAALRKELASRSDSFTEADLQAVPADANLPGSSEAAAPQETQVMIRGMKFNPATIEVKKGTAVEWKNDDITPHTATAPSFDSGSIGPEKSWRRTFTETGTFPYACTFHPEMKGVVIVK
jgi:mono/diheme cytochrome c family protein/plastocyanin